MEFKIKNRKLNTHKGDYGKVAIIGGSRGMAGAVVLSAKAALRTGCGLVQSIVPEIIGDIVAIGCFESTLTYIKAEDEFIDNSSLQIKKSLADIDAVAFGPGLGRNLEKSKILETLIKSQLPMVIDADGLDLLSKNLHHLKNRTHPIILTPHMGEMSKLTRISVNELNSNRKKYGEIFSSKYKVYLVLKGNKTQVFGPSGKYYENTTGNPSMATGGSGDILTGIIASLLAQGYDPFQSATMGVYLHGLAGDFSRDNLGEDSVIASDLIKYLPEAIKSIKENNG